MTGKYFNESHWRKNKQWFALNRAHVKAIVEDTYIKKRFEEHCQAYREGTTLCVSDEHYIASALAVYKFENEVSQETAFFVNTRTEIVPWFYRLTVLAR